MESEWELCEAEERNLVEMFNWMENEQEDDMDIYIEQSVNHVRVLHS